MPPVHTLVLLEGRSDVAAVRVVAAARGLAESEHGYRLVDLGGITNVRRYLAGVGDRRVLGMCDAAEAHVVARALRLGEAELSASGFWVCDADLEEELIRACGPERALAVLDGLSLTARFGTFCSQPAGVARPRAA